MGRRCSSETESLAPGLSRLPARPRPLNWMAALAFAFRHSRLFGHELAVLERRIKQPFIRSFVEESHRAPKAILFDSQGIIRAGIGIESQAGKRREEIGNIDPSAL